MDGWIHIHSIKPGDGLHERFGFLSADNFIIINYVHCCLFVLNLLM